MQLIRQIEGKIVGDTFMPVIDRPIKLVLSDKKYLYGEYEYSLTQWKKAEIQSESLPVRVGMSHTVGTEEEFYLFMYKGLYYMTEINMDGNEVLLALKNLWRGKKYKLTRELERIKAKAESEDNVRMPIPEDVQILVWNRDGGKCVKCGGIQNLEFDHIIPLSKGGGNTARNIQLLCEHCNRSKGASIGG